MRSWRSRLVCAERHKTQKDAGESEWLHFPLASIFLKRTLTNENCEVVGRILVVKEPKEFQFKEWLRVWKSFPQEETYSEVFIRQGLTLWNTENEIIPSNFSKSDMSFWSNEIICTVGTSSSSRYFSIGLIQDYPNGFSGCDWPERKPGSNSSSRRIGKTMTTSSHSPERRQLRGIQTLFHVPKSFCRPNGHHFVRPTELLSNFAFSQSKKKVFPFFVASLFSLRRDRSHRAAETSIDWIETTCFRQPFHKRTLRWIFLKNNGKKRGASKKIFLFF